MKRTTRSTNLCSTDTFCYYWSIKLNISGPERLLVETNMREVSKADNILAIDGAVSKRTCYVQLFRNPIIEEFILQDKPYRGCLGDYIGLMCRCCGRA